MSKTVVSAAEQLSSAADTVSKGLFRMEKILIMCRSMTQAQRSQRLLERNGIMSSLVKAPVNLTRSGCGYALILRRHGAEGIQILRDADMLTGRIYEKNNEEWREIARDLS